MPADACSSFRVDRNLARVLNARSVPKRKGESATLYELLKTEELVSVDSVTSNVAGDNRKGLSDEDTCVRSSI